MTEIQPPEKIYRYRRTGASLSYTLVELTGLLWCAYAKTLNDPFDGLAAIAPETQNYIVDSLRIPGGPDERRNLEKNWSIASFSETWELPTMWAHYADNYSGICFVYDFAKLTKKIEMFMEVMDRRPERNVRPHVRLSKVEYFEQLIPSSNPFNAARYKTDHWSYEREWRIISQGFSGDGLGNENGSMLRLDGAIDSVIYGPKTDATTIRVLRSAIAKMDTNIRLEALKIDHSNGRLWRDLIV